MHLSEVGQVLAALRAGEAAIIPTDTVYGLAVAPAFAPGPQRLFELKGRPDGKPVAWLVSAPECLGQYGCDVPEWAWHLARRFWPGALTLVVKASPTVPPAFCSQEGTIGLRMPDDALTLEIIGNLGGALATTSANPSGKPAPHRFSEIDAALLASVPAVIDGGERGSGTASTVVDCTGPEPRILREGALAAQILATRF